MSKSSNIRELIKREILEGKLPDGTRLLPVRQLAQQYDVSYLTMSHVLDQLEEEKLILRVHGRGVFVNYQPEKLPPQRYRVLLIYHGQDAIMPLFLDKLLNFFYNRHAELTMFEISALDHLSPAARQAKLREYLSTPADLLIADGSYYLPFKEIDKHRSNFRKFVFFNRYESSFELSNSARLLYDYHAAGALAAETLLANGSKKSLYIDPDSGERRNFPPFCPPETYHCRMRAGICEVLANSKAKLHNLVTTPAKAVKELNKILDTFKPDGIVVFHDYYALKVYHALTLHKLKPGKQVDVIGCFNTAIGQAWLTPGLTTIGFDADKMLATLDEYLSGTAENLKMFIPPHLILRDSLKKVSQPTQEV